MAEELQYDSSTNKRKYDDNSPSPASAARRPTGFSAPISTQSPPPASYNSVPPPVDEIQLAKQKAQEIAARLCFNAEAVKRPRVDDGDSNGDGGLKPHIGGVTPPMTGSYGYGSPSKRIEIPNGRVGVIIGKGGETIKYLQLQSGAKIQVTRDMDADPHSQSRGVELTGTSEQISKAEQLIKDVLAEAEAGGSGLVSRRITGQHSGGAEQFVMKVPNNKVGLVIGKGGETIKNMQATTGARIQVIPLHLPPGDTSTERTCQIDGTAEQIEAAKQLVNEVISENRLRNPSMGGYQQQGYQARPPTNWAQGGGAPMQQPGYGGYMQPGAYPGQNPQYNTGQAPYSGYPQPASGGYGAGWDQSSAPQTQQTSQGAGYDYYSQQPTAQQAPGGPGAPATENASYGYGQAPASGYSQGQGYGQDGYGGYPAAPPQSYYGSQANSAGGYDQQGYNSASGYGNASNPTPDGSAAYGSQGDASQTTQPAQSAATGQQGYVSGQQPSPNAAYQSQGATGYAMPPASQGAYGSQPPTGYGSGYGTQAQKPPANQPPYGQPQQSPSAQGGYPQSAPAYPPPAQSGYAAPTAQSGYAAPPYGAPAATQQSYGQQPPAYNSAYGGGYAQPAAYGDNSSGGSAQTTQAGKTSPPS